MASFVGWIAFPIMRDGEVAGAFLIPRTGEWRKVKEQDVETIVARSPFKPDR